MLSQSFKRVKRANSLFSCRLLLTCRHTTIPAPLLYRGALAQYHNTPSDSGDSDKNIRPKRPHRRKRLPNEKGHESRRIQLGYSSLGNPGEVFVVQEKPRPSRSTASEEPEADTSALPSMLSEIESEKAPFDRSTVDEQIESFRLPFQPRVNLAPVDWVDIQSKLYRSFTTLQLKEYISRHPKEHYGTEGSLPGRGQSNPAEWRPGTSLFLETGPVSRESVATRVSAVREFKGKELLVEVILRDIWELGMMNELGQLDIRLPTHSLTLLINSELFSFEELADLNEAKIDVTHSLGLMRITGSQRACESIREIILDTSKRIQQEELNLLPLGQARPQIVSQAFSPDFLSWVGKTYKVSFEQDSSQLPIRIHYLLENKATVDAARRILNLALNKASSPSIPFTTYLSASKPSEIHDVHPGDTASWPDRKKSWFRWGGPMDEKDLARLPGYFLTGSQHAISDELLRFLREAPSMKADFKSVPVVRDSITATVGKCLFLRSPLFQGTQASASQLGTMGLPRTFTNYVPRALQLIRALGSTDLEKEWMSHRIQLMPTALYADVFPKLELDIIIAVDESGNQGDCALRSAKAILAESNVDYLLPESATDIRFTRTLTHDILEGSQEVPSLETILSSLLDCFNESMTSNKEVPLPIFTSVTLPDYLLRRSPGGQDLIENATAEYMYLPVNDVQGTRTRRFALRDQPLFYASYESGPFGPHTTTDLYLQKEFSQDASTSDRVNASLQQEEFTSFYRSVCALASELDLHQ